MQSKRIVLARPCDKRSNVNATRVIFPANPDIFTSHGKFAALVRHPAKVARSWILGAEIFGSERILGAEICVSGTMEVGILSSTMDRLLTDGDCFQRSRRGEKKRDDERRRRMHVAQESAVHRAAAYQRRIDSSARSEK